MYIDHNEPEGQGINYVNSPWEANVSTRGIFAGFPETVNGLEWLLYGYDLATVWPGTNNQ